MNIPVDQPKVSELDAKAISAARVWYNAHFNGLPDTETLVEGVVTAYLSALIGIPGAEAGPDEPPFAWVRMGKNKWFWRYSPPTGQSGNGWFPVYRSHEQVAAPPALTAGREQVLEEALAALADQTEVLLSVEDDMPTAKQDYADTEAALERARAALKATTP
jgi:hypothetical protein